MDEMPDNMQVNESEFIQIIHDCFDPSFFTGNDAFRVDHRALLHGLRYLAAAAMEGEISIREDFAANEKLLDVADFFVRINTIANFLSNTLENVKLYFNVNEDNSNHQKG